MQAWLIELGTGVGLCLGGVGLWALPKDTPVVGRPPVLAGWLVIALGVLILAVSMVTRSGYEVQVGLKRKSGLVRNDLPRAEHAAALPWPPPVPKPVQRIYSDATVAELVALGQLPHLTNAERARLLAPHVGKWLRIEGVVDDVNVYPGFVQVVIRSDEATPLPIAFFRSDLDRVAALRKGARIQVSGKFTGTAPINSAVVVDECELLS